MPTLLRLTARLAACCAALLTLLGGAARADDGAHVFWEVAGAHNTVYLLGSVHVLHANDHALPPVTEAAYADAEKIVEELDLFAAAAEMLTPPAMAHQMLPAGQTLPAVLGPALHQRVQVAAKELGLDASFLAGMQPWFVATMISELRLGKAGYSAQDGVDFQIAARAQRDGKPIVGLETLTQQLSFLSAMSMDEQREFLAATLDEDASASELQEITAAWRRGDLQALEALLRKGDAEMPELFQRIVVDRNRNWLPRLEQMLADPADDYLVVTGALHMVGEQGLVELLRRKGYTVTRR
ncbi:MAG: TraB/GumN family protein [Steroidobacteraceae bacterium]